MINLSTKNKLIRLSFIVIIILIIFLIVKSIFSNHTLIPNTTINTTSRIELFNSIKPTITTLTTTPTTTPTTTTPVIIVPTINQTIQSACDNPTSVPSVCMNYDSCCGNTSIGTNSTCFCNHPFVKNCYDEFKKCQTTPTSTPTSTNCQDILTNCCSKYTENDILASNFNSPINKNQYSDKLCTLTGVANLEQRCMELCQTNPNCKAYSLVTGGCTLYSKINTTSGYNPETDNSIYITKK